MHIRRPFSRRAYAAIVAAISGAAVMAACGSSSSGASKSTPSDANSAAPAKASFASSAFTTNLAGVCPSTLSIQLNWLSEADFAGLYELIGDGGTAKQYSYEGPLGSTGIKLDILAGGPGDGNLSPEATLFAGNHVAGVTPQISVDSTEDIIQLSKKFPTVGIANLQDHGPQILIYSPSKFPQGLPTIASLIAAAKSGAMFYVTSLTTPYVQYLISKGVPEGAFIGGYTGDLDKFVTGGGKIVNQGYVDAETWELQTPSATPAWGGKPIGYQLIYKYGLDDYPSSLLVAQDKLPSLSPCLKKFVPLVQQGLVDYFKDPTTVDNLLAKLDPKYSASYWSTPVAENSFSAQSQLKNGVAENSDADGGAIGAFNLTRLQQNIGQLLPIFQKESPGTFIPNAKSSDVATNQFIDPTIKLAS